MLFSFLFFVFFERECLFERTGFLGVRGYGRVSSFLLVYVRLIERTF